MSNIYIGYILAIITSLTFAVYVIPRKISKIDSVRYLLWFSLGLLFTVLIFYITQAILLKNPEVISLKNFIYSAPMGVMWAFGSYALIKGIDSVGISKSNQWKNLQGPISLILSLFLLRELAEIKIIFVILAGLAIFGSALAINIVTEKKSVNNSGILYSFLAAIFFGSAATYGKFLVNSNYFFTQLFSIGIFFLVSAFIIYTLKKPKIKGTQKEIYLPILGGFLFAISALMMFLTYKYLPASIGYTIIQLNALWVVLAGIIIFKEIDYKKNMLRINIGLFLAIFSVVTLFFANK